MKDLNILIEDKVKEFEKLEDTTHSMRSCIDANVAQGFLRQSLQEIAQATIEAIKVEKVTMQPLIIPHMQDESEGDFVAKIYNSAITAQDQKAKQFLGDKE